MTIFDSQSYVGPTVVPGVAANAASVVAAMEQRNIDGALLFSAYARDVDPIVGNRILKASLDQAPSLVGCLVTHANRVESSVAVLREMMSSKRIVAMAIVGAQAGQAVSLLMAEEILGAYRRYGKPVCLYTPDAEAVEHGLTIAREHAMLKFIFLGMGGADWRSAVAAAHSCTNILLETSGAMDRAKIPAALDAVGTHRVLFGSASPEMDAAAALGLLQDCELSDDARRRVLGENARRLFALEQSA